MDTRFTRFDWLLDDRRHVRGNLRQIRTAIRRGQFDGAANGERRAALMAALEQLIDQPTHSIRTIIALAALQLEMIEQGMS